jgi:hypothetical protein
MTQPEELDDEPVAPRPKAGPAVRPQHLLILLLLLLGAGGFAASGPVCNTKELGRDVKDLTRQEIIEQAVNRFKDLTTTITFANTTHVLSKPMPVNPSAPGLTVNTVLAVKKVGDRSDVVTHHAGNGFIAYKLRQPDGACGYVFSTDQLQVTSQ